MSPTIQKTSYSGLTSSAQTHTSNKFVFKPIKPAKTAHSREEPSATHDGLSTSNNYYNPDENHCNKHQPQTNPQRFKSQRNKSEESLIHTKSLNPMKNYRKSNFISETKHQIPLPPPLNPMTMPIPGRRIITASKPAEYYLDRIPILHSDQERL